MYQTLYLFWPIHYCMNFFYTNDKNINLNIIKLTHSIISSGLSYYYIQIPEDNIKNIIFHCSNSYFLWDTLQLIYERNINNLPYLYHHLIVLYMLYQLYSNINQLIIVNLLCVGELSNICIYTTYHLIKTKCSLIYINISKVIQILWYGYFRIYIFTLMMYNYFTLVENRSLAYILSTIYFMGWGWWFTQINKLYNDLIPQLKYS